MSPTSQLSPGRRRSLAFQEWLIKRHPRVRYLRESQGCVALRSGSPVKAYWKPEGGRQDDPVILERYRCKNHARWSFRHLKRDWHAGQTRVYCWSHLYHYALFGSMEETAATERLMVRSGYARPDQTLTQRA